LPPGTSGDNRSGPQSDSKPPQPSKKITAHHQQKHPARASLQWHANKLKPSKPNGHYQPALKEEVTACSPHVVSLVISTANQRQSPIYHILCRAKRRWRTHQTPNFGDGHTKRRLLDTVWMTMWHVKRQHSQHFCNFLTRREHNDATDDGDCILFSTHTLRGVVDHRFSHRGATMAKVCLQAAMREVAVFRESHSV
jgi:hypothetical protein